MRWLALVVVVACHHDAPAPAEPAGTPPLPPASGTPIGYLIDDATDLHLTEAQVGKLRDIDTSLAAELEVIDSQVRQANRPPDPDPSQQTGRRGGRRGGMGMGGMGGGMGGTGGSSGGSSGGRHRGSGAGSNSPAHAANLDKLTEQRTADVRDALHRVFELLDTGQQVAAKKVLIAHDVDLDTGGTGTGSSPMPTPPTSEAPAQPVFIKPPPAEGSAAPPPVFIKPPPQEHSNDNDGPDPEPEP